VNCGDRDDFGLAQSQIIAISFQAEFAKVVFPVLRKNSAKAIKSKQAFIGEARNVCLAWSGI